MEKESHEGEGGMRKGEGRKGEGRNAEGHIMFKYACMILLLIFLSLSGPVLADDQLSEILEGIKNRYGPLPGLTVTYERDVITRSMTLLGGQMKTDPATGRIHFKPPHFLRVQQETPRPEDVISDGDTLWWYIPQKREVYRYPSHKLGQELRLLGDIFRGLRNVKEGFEVILTGYDTAGRHQVKLIPRPPWPQIDHINISVAQGTFHIRVVEIHNYLGGLTRFTLGVLTIKERFEEDFFRFVAPEGVKVIEEKG